MGLPGQKSRAYRTGRTGCLPDLPATGGALPDRYTGFENDTADYAAWVRSNAGVGFEDMPELADRPRGLWETRRRDLEVSLNLLGSTRSSSLRSPTGGRGCEPDIRRPLPSNGTWIANGNPVVRHLGRSTVSVPIRVMADIGMPIELTYAAAHAETLMPGL